MQIPESAWRKFVLAHKYIEAAAERQMKELLGNEASAGIGENFGEAANAEQWVAYRTENRNGRAAKVPVNPKTGRNARTNDPATWGTLNQAQEALRLYDADGVGFVLANGYFGIDLDHVIDPDTGTIAEYALDIISRMDSYTEISPSGTGIHIIAKGTPLFDTNKNGSVEMYYPTQLEDGTITKGRYFTATGKAFGPPRPIAERTGEAQEIWADYIQGKPELSRTMVKASPTTVDYAYAVATKYGEASAALSCQMYDEIAAAQGVTLPPAEPAPTATYGETAKAVRGTLKNRRSTVPATTARLVKQTGADTMLFNARRDGAEFAWIPMGDSCPFCLMLGSRGWQRMSRKALKNGHAEHIHSNCDCQYCVRHDGKSTVSGYEPEKLLEVYNDASDGGWKDKLRAMRRDYYKANADEINEQKRIAYARRRQAAGESGGGSASSGT